MGGARVGPREPVSAKHAVCATHHPIVVRTALDVMRSGGNAIDATIAACLVQATIQQGLTSFAGTVTLLYWEASSGRTYELNSTGTFVPDLPPCRPVVRALGGELDGRCAVVPGFMPAMKVLHERFSTKSWAQLCEPAIHWAEQGHEVDSFEHMMMSHHGPYFMHTEEGRRHFAPNGHAPEVGDVWPNPPLAATLRALAHEGPDHFTTGDWGRQFVARGNALGWPIEQRHMVAIPPRWGEGLRYRHRDYEIVQLSPPQIVAVHSAIVLGVLESLDIASLGHYSTSAAALYYVAHALRRAEYEVGLVYDPEIFGDPTSTLMSREFHAHLADVLRNSRPKIDLSNHVRMISGRTAPADAGARKESSCELSLVDPQGNWVQMMNTTQSGGIPGEIIGGVPMHGSALQPTLDSPYMGGWFTGGARMRRGIANTLVFKDGRPIWSLGTPGVPSQAVAQVLLNGLVYGMDPYRAEDLPRMLPLTDDYRVQIESRIPDSLVADVAKLGILVDPMPPYTVAGGGFQMSWRDDDGTLHAMSSARYPGDAGGF